ncbi:MAG: dipeptide epimerase [Armatimonadetes bacterium]|nr:dipeptide epimerase [Armatimonadota bacterium]
MRIAGYQLYRTRLQCHKPFKIATGASDVCSGLVLRLETEDGGWGYGEAVPNPYLTGETFDGAVAALKELILPGLMNADAWHVGIIHQKMSSVVIGHPSARAAVDMAVHDLLSRAAGVPLASLLGGPGGGVETDFSIGLCRPDEAAREARAIVEKGFRAIKLKVGADAAEDVDRVKAVRGAIGPDLKLRIDANEGWDLPGATRALREMEHYRVELVEQPLPRWDLRGLAELRRRVDVPIAADEAVHSPRDALRALEAGAVDIINIKLMKSGGLGPAREIAAMARAAGVRLMIGGMVGESRISVTAAAALASALSFEYCDLDADLLLADQLVEEGGARLEGDRRVLDSAPGLGIADLNKAFLTRLV